MAFSEQLLQWWDQHGRKDLPWQYPRSAFRVWIAEIMLQQTQVKTVIPYFNRFIEHFPNLKSLADASTDDVLALWSGLGYYARARNLLKAAKICKEDHGAELPVTPEELATLPGIGASTANAIYSQAQDKPAAILDGNVKRVLTRYLAVDGWPGKSDVAKHLWIEAEKLLPKYRGADYTQAIMDLGATLCTRSKPACEQCPVSNSCLAYANGSVEDYPAPRPKLKRARKPFHMLILTDGNGRVLLERRPPTGIWGGLWCLPADDDGRSLLPRLGLDSNQARQLPKLRHELTHISMDIQPMIVNTKMLPVGVECTQDLNWFKPLEWPSLGLPKPARQLLERYLENDEK